jgi:hypothetical protein
VVALSALMTMAISIGSGETAVWEKMTQSFATMFPVAAPPQKLQPCFTDYPFAKDLQDSMTSESPHCAGNRVIRVPCPKRAHCANGYLVSCNSDYFEPSAAGTTCVWKAHELGQCNLWREALEQWTIDTVCSKTSLGTQFLVSNDETSESSRPLFDYKSAAEELDMTYDPKLLRTVNDEREDKVFLIKKSDSGAVLIGLHHSQAIELPFECSVSQWAWRSWGTLVGLSGTIVRVLATCIWSFMLQHPLISFAIGAFLCYAVMYWKMKRAHYRTAAAFYNFRDDVFEEISNSSPHSIPADIIRDRIINRKHLPPKAHKEMISLFPKVKQFIEDDKRVKKEYQPGNVVLWQWLDHEPFKRNRRGNDTRSVQFSEAQ